MKTKLQISLAVNEKAMNCYLEVPNEFVSLDKQYLRESLELFYEKFPDTEVLSVCRLETSTQEIGQCEPCEVRMTEAKAIIDEVMYSRRRFA